MSYELGIVNESRNIPLDLHFSGVLCVLEGFAYNGPVLLKQDTLFISFLLTFHASHLTPDASRTIHDFITETI